MARAAGVAFLLVLAACAPNDPRVVLKSLHAQLAQQYHECVPLGWDPVPVFARAFYRGYSSEYIPEITWLPPRWLGSIQTRYLHQPEVRASFDLLNELVRIHMVQRTDVPGGFRYNL